MPSTRVRENVVLILSFVVISVSGLLWMAINTGQRFGPLPPSYQVSFEVRDADAIAEGSDVRIAGVPVGKVRTVTTIDRGSRVVMAIDPGFAPVDTDAIAMIRPKSLLGEKYVDLTRGVSNVEVPDGGALPPTQAFTQVELDQVLQNMDAPTRAAVSVDFQALGGAVAGRGPDVNATIPELRRIAEHLTPVSARFKDRTAQIDHILVDTDMILRTLADEHRQLATLLQSADTTTSTVAVNDQHLAGLLNNGSSMLARLNTAAAQSNNDQNLRTALEQSPQMLADASQLLGASRGAVNELLPSLVVASQNHYPRDELSAATPLNVVLNELWDSSFTYYDPANGYHAYGMMTIQCSDGTYKCPATYLKDSNGIPRSQGATPQSTVPARLPDEATANAFLGYLLGQ